MGSVSADVYATIERDGPRFMMPEAEKSLVERCYQKASSVLEYGAGGSTGYAAGLPDKRVVSIESDAEWLGALRRYFDRNPGTADLTLVHADIGKTEKFGYPAFP